MVAGLDWIILNHPEVDVVNLILGSGVTVPGEGDDATAVLRVKFIKPVDQAAAEDAASYTLEGPDKETIRRAALLSDGVTVELTTTPLRKSTL